MTISRALARPLSRPLKRNLYSSTSNLTPAFSLFSGATLSPLVTFTRASSATYFDSAGVMQTAATNAPRIDYDPATLAFKGLLVEEARTNVFTYSDDLTNAAWNKFASTITANDAIGSDGVLSLDKVLYTAGSNQVPFYGQGNSVTSGASYSVSFEAKYGNFQWLWIRLDHPADLAAFDLQNGAIGGTSGASITGHSIADLGGGLYRCTVTWTANATASANVVWQYGTGSAPSAANTTKAGTEFFYLGKAQLEAGAFATSYIPTAAATATRAADAASVTGTNFSSWRDSPAAESWVVEFDTKAGAASQRIIYLNGTAIPMYFTFDSGPKISYFDGTAESKAVIDSSSTSLQKVAVTYSDSTGALSVNGATPVAGTFDGLMTGVEMFIGSIGGSANLVNGHIKSLDYYSSRLPDATLVELST